MDALEKDRLRRRMAKDIQIFMGAHPILEVVSGHWLDDERPCDLAPEIRSHELVVVKNRAGRKMTLAVSTLTEMVRFKVVEEAIDLPKWLEKLKLLRADAEKRKEQQEKEREEQRSKLERKLIVRKRSSANP